MYQSYYDIASLDYDVIVLLSVAMRQLVVSMHYAAQSAARRYANCQDQPSREPEAA